MAALLRTVVASGGYRAVEEKASGQFLGWFHLRPGEGHGPDEPELGYRLRRSAWGKGYATEGCLALIDKAFTEHGVRRVLAETMAVHTASRRVMEKCGVRSCGRSTGLALSDPGRRTRRRRVRHRPSRMGAANALGYPR